VPKLGETTGYSRPKYLIVGSSEPYSGKTSTILGLAEKLQTRGLNIGYSKPLGTCLNATEKDGIDEDVRFLGKTLDLPQNNLGETLLFLEPDTIAKQLQGHDRHDYPESFLQSLQGLQGDLVLVEGPSTLDRGRLFDLSVPQMSALLESPVLLVTRFHSVLDTAALICVKERLGDRLLGIVLTDIPADEWERASHVVAPFLESREIPVFGLLPMSNLLHSVSVEQLVRRLKAEVLCCHDRLDLMVETLRIGAMNVNSALKYFSAADNMAVITGGDRTDIQLAALETATNCLILTGHLPPTPMIISRAEELEIPVLSVDLDTLTTVEIIEQTLGHVRLYEPIKVEYIKHAIAEHFALDRLLDALGLDPVAV
jgi:BioD-like phosphotransacetylase family protein